MNSTESSGAAVAWTERYEHLRSEALSGRNRARGLTIFLRKGLSGWMVTWEQMVPAVPARPASATLTAIPAPPVDLRGRLAEGLAGMILRLRQRQKETE